MSIKHNPQTRIINKITEQIVANKSPMVESLKPKKKGKIKAKTELQFKHNSKANHFRSHQLHHRAPPLWQAASALLAALHWPHCHHHHLKLYASASVLLFVWRKRTLPLFSLCSSDVVIRPYLVLSCVSCLLFYFILLVFCWAFDIFLFFFFIYLWFLRWATYR